MLPLKEINQLLIEKFTIFPIVEFPFLKYLNEKFYEALKDFKEVKKESKGEFSKRPSLDKYGKIYFASGYHHPFFRLLRSICYSKIIDKVRQCKKFKSINCFFTEASKGFSIREEMFQVKETQNLFFRGWFNLSLEPQFFEFFEGMKKSLIIPPGYCVLYHPNLIQILSRGKERFYLSFQVSDEILFTDKKVVDMIQKQSSPYKNFLRGNKEKIENWSLFLREDLKEKKDTPSLFELNDMFPAYTKEEINILRPYVF